MHEEDVPSCLCLHLTKLVTIKTIFEGCYNSKYKHTKLTFKVSNAPLDFMDAPSNLQLIIVTLIVNVLNENSSKT
jgi:hypothetical protein